MGIMDGGSLFKGVKEMFNPEQPQPQPPTHREQPKQGQPAPTLQPLNGFETDYLREVTHIESFAKLLFSSFGAMELVFDEDKDSYFYRNIPDLKPIINYEGIIHITNFVLSSLNFNKLLSSYSEKIVNKKIYDRILDFKDFIVANSKNFASEQIQNKYGGLLPVHLNTLLDMYKNILEDTIRRAESGEERRTQREPKIYQHTEQHNIYEEPRKKFLGLF